jgi:Xaa-Pro aminopeptidase
MYETYMSVHLEAAKVIATGLKELGLMKGTIDEAVVQGAHALFFPHGLGHLMGLDVHDMENLGENYIGYDEEIKRSSLFGTGYLRYGKKLKKGLVLTNEPGIYFIPALINTWRKENKFADFINYDKIDEYEGFGGVRLEDDYIITEDGGKLIGERIPIKPDDIEKSMS